MRTKGNKLTCCSSRHSFLMKINSKLSSSKKNIHKISKRLCSSELHSCTKRKGTKKKNTLGKFIESLKKISDHSSARSQSNFKLGSKKASHLDIRNSWKNESCGGAIKRKRRRRKKKKKKNIVLDQASCLQRRARYLLIKMKLELNLIDAYSGDGWKGQSKEKIKPENELQRAGKQILKCKSGIRDTIRQLDLLSSKGSIAESVIYPDGSVFHEHIFCAKCKSREAFPDNDIILCDGTCNCGFHQKCLEPPLETIPPADQGWICKICDCKMEILEAINAHIGTSFPVNSSWEDIFNEVTSDTNPDNTILNGKEEWQSEDSKDEDYDPELIENSSSRTGIEQSMSDDASSSSSLFCASDEVKTCSNLDYYQKREVKSKNKKEFEPVDSVISIDSGEYSDHEITGYRRQRRDVDYKKLYDEMFGKELHDNEQQSEDEDWGPQRRKWRRRELGADTMMVDCGDKDGCSNMVVHENISRDRRKLFRIPHDAVEKLRQVFAKNELPSRDIKENLALELGISAEKISKWFKNARYTALKIRKAERTNEPLIVDDYKKSRSAEKQKSDDEESMDNSYLLPLSSIVRVPRNFRKILQRSSSSISAPLEKRYEGIANELPTDKIQKLRSVLLDNQCPSISIKGNLAKELGLPCRQVNAWFQKAVHKKTEVSDQGRNSPLEETVHNGAGTDPAVDETTESEQLYLVELERLCSLEVRLQNLKNTLLSCIDNGQTPNESHPNEENVMYVPVVEIKEKSHKV